MHMTIPGLRHRDPRWNGSCPPGIVDFTFPRFHAVIFPSCYVLWLLLRPLELRKHYHRVYLFVRHQVLKSFSYRRPRSRCLYLFRKENNLKLYIFILLYREKKVSGKKKGFINTLPILVNIAHRGNPLRDRLPAIAASEDAQYLRRLSSPSMGCPGPAGTPSCSHLELVPGVSVAGQG